MKKSEEYKNNIPSHSFIVCAYKDSDHLETMLDSLLAQTRKSTIRIATSTPTKDLYAKAKKYDIEVVVNDKSEGIGSDWSFAYELAETDFVTLAHQDDIFLPEYTEKVLSAIARSKNPIIAYTDYYELRSKGPIYSNTLLRVKRLMNAPIGWFSRSRFVRRRVLSMGCSVNCWSVTYNRKRFPDFRFHHDYKVSLDWDAWERLSTEEGEFIYVPDILTAHRVHTGSTTTACIDNGDRFREDLEMFQRFWPPRIATFLLKFYERSLKSNKD